MFVFMCVCLPYFVKLNCSVLSARPYHIPYVWISCDGQQLLAHIWLVPSQYNFCCQTNLLLPPALFIVALETKLVVAFLFSESEVIDALYANQK